MIFTDLAIALSTCDDAFMRSRSALTILRRILAKFVDPFSPTTPCGFDAGFAARRVIPPRQDKLLNLSVAASKLRRLFHDVAVYQWLERCLILCVDVPYLPEMFHPLRLYVRKILALLHLLMQQVPELPIDKHIAVSPGAYRLTLAL